MRDVEPLGAGFGIAPEQMLHAVKSRRTIRQYTQRRPTREELETILEAARFSPTASNAQNVSYIVISERMEELRALAMEEMRKLRFNEEDFYKVFPPPMSLSRVKFEDDNFLFKGAPALILRSRRTRSTPPSPAATWRCRPRPWASARSMWASS